MWYSSKSVEMFANQFYEASKVKVHILYEVLVFQWLEAFSPRCTLKFQRFHLLTACPI